MTKRTIEILVETEDLLVVNQRGRAVSLKCSECGGPVERARTDGALVPSRSAAEIVGNCVAVSDESIGYFDSCCKQSEWARGQSTPVD